MSVQAGLDDDHAGRREEAAVRKAFKAHLSPAFARRAHQVAGIDPTGNPTVSLATCEKVPTSDTADAEPSGDRGKSGDTSVYKDPPQEYPETAEDLDYITAATEAIRESVARSRERQRKVLALIQAGEVAHAKRLATCGRKSVHLECGNCGSDENYVPISCGSRLCSDCMNEKMGRVAGQYLPVVKDWEYPTMMRLSLPKRVEPERVEPAVDALRGAFGRLRRRKIQVDDDTFEKWMGALRAVGERRLAKRFEVERRNGRGVPFEEIVRSGFYGIDIKQGEDGTLNVHMHVLADIPYLPQSVLSDLWDDVIGAPVVDIRRVEQRGQSDEESALMEVVGYAAKAPEYESVEDEVEYVKALKGSKLIQPFGELHGNTPPSHALLFCCTCERTPEEWMYLGTVDGGYQTVGVGSAPDGDRPPP